MQITDAIQYFLQLEVSLVNDRPFALTNTSIEVVLRDYQRFEAVSTDVVTVPWIVSDELWINLLLSANLINNILIND